MTHHHVLIATTTDTSAEAETLAEAAAVARLAACAHIAEIRSVYWWAGELQMASEYRLEFKTRAELAEPLSEFLLARHSYDMPQVIVSPIIGGSADYLAWIDAETRPGTDPDA